MNEIHFRRSETQFTQKIDYQSQFHIGEKVFHESEIEIRSRDLDFHLGKVQFHFGEIHMEKV